MKINSVHILLILIGIIVGVLINNFLNEDNPPVTDNSAKINELQREMILLKDSIESIKVEIRIYKLKSDSIDKSIKTLRKKYQNEKVNINSNAHDLDSIIRANVKFD